MRLLLCITGILLLAACNPVANLESGSDKIDQFHDLYSTDDHNGLYRFVGKEFREATSREQFQELLDVVSVRLGDVEASERSGFNVNTTPAGTVTTVTMNTSFELGDGVETFTFLGNGDEMELVGWFVNSDRLMISAADLAELSGKDEQEPE